VSVWTEVLLPGVAAQVRQFAPVGLTEAFTGGSLRPNYLYCVRDETF
jgi:hypothetical protein